MSNQESTCQRSTVGQRTGLWLTSVRKTCVPSLEARGRDPEPPASTPRLLAGGAGADPAEPSAWCSWLLWTQPLRHGRLLALSARTLVVA